MEQEQRVKKRKRKQDLINGVMFLTVANVIVKIFGFFYKVPLNAVLGDEMANVNAAYAVYALLYTISTAGVPGAISLSVSRARAQGRGERVQSIFRTSFSALFLLGVLLASLLMAFSKPLSHLNSGGDSYLCLLAISPALAFAAANSVLRGFFQGHEDMYPTAFSELLEAIGKTVFGLFFAYLALSVFGVSAHASAAFAVFAITIGVGMSAFFLVAVYMRKRKHLFSGSEKPKGGEVGILLDVFKIALPITAASAMISLSSLLDAQWMRPLLTAYYGDATVAKSLYSDYSTGALTLYNLPSILVTPMSVAIIPHIAAALEKGERRKATRAMESAFRASALLSLPCALGLCALAAPILRFVFRGDGDMAENTAHLLSILAAAVFFVAVFSVSSAALQAAKHEKTPLLSLGVGLATKLVLLFVLTPQYGEIGIPFSTVAFFFAASAVNLFFVQKKIGLQIRFARVFLKPALAAILSSVSAWGSFYLLFPYVGNSISLLLSIAVAIFIYVCAAFLLRCIGAEELLLLPFLKNKPHLFQKIRSKNTSTW